MGDYDDVWARFRRERRLEFGGHTDPSWQDGHELSASFMVPVQAAKFRGRIEPLREALRDFSFVSLHPDHFMHITLVLLGFLVDEPHEEGEVSRERLRDIRDRAGAVLADFPPFPVTLANLNAFPGAAFVEAHDGGMLGRLRGDLGSGCGLKVAHGPPHLTIAYFQAEDGAEAPEELVSTIARYRDWPLGEVTVEAVEMTLLNLGSPYPEPKTLARLRLGGAVDDGPSSGD